MIPPPGPQFDDSSAPSGTLTGTQRCVARSGPLFLNASEPCRSRQIRRKREAPWSFVANIRRSRREHAYRGRSDPAENHKPQSSPIGVDTRAARRTRRRDSVADWKRQNAGVPAPTFGPSGGAGGRPAWPDRYADTRARDPGGGRLQVTRFRAAQRASLWRSWLSHPDACSEARRRPGHRHPGPDPRHDREEAGLPEPG